MCFQLMANPFEFRGPHYVYTYMHIEPNIKIYV